jgi:hypothetical protein
MAMTLDPVPHEERERPGGDPERNPGTAGDVPGFEDQIVCHGAEQDPSPEGRD